MKTKVLIIEDNFSKFFTTKQVLESHLKLDVKVQNVESGRELAETAVSFGPDAVLCCPSGGVVELVAQLKKRRTNRRNTEITLLLIQDIEDDMVRRFQLLLEQKNRGAAAA